MSELINKDALIVIFKPLIKSLFDKEKEEAEGATINIDEFRKKYCGGKGKEWVRVFIFDEFPEIDFENGGFVVNPRGGKKTIIFRKDAKKWIEKTITVSTGMQVLKNWRDKDEEENRLATCNCLLRDNCSRLNANYYFWILLLEFVPLRR